MAKIVCINSLGEVCVKGTGLGGTNVLSEDECKQHRECELILHVRSLMKWNDSRMRVWYAKGRIWNSIEFAMWTQDSLSELGDQVDWRAWWKDYRDRFARLKNKLSPEVGVRRWTMDRCEYVNKYRDNVLSRWVTHPDHGRMRKQVSVDVEVRDKADVVRTRKLVTGLFGRSYQQAGVAVL